MDKRLPLHLISGFLGSGKTTLLRRMLDTPALGNSAVLVNEVGEIGLDHHLLRHVDGETVLLRSGCICCSMRDDLGQALKDLLNRRDVGLLSPFARVIVEGTGLADPVPILSTVLADPSLRHHFRIGRVVTVVDTVNAALQLQTQMEFAKQVAVADHILLSKTDIAPPGALPALVPLLAGINPGAGRALAVDPALDLASLLAEPDGPAALRREAAEWIRPLPPQPARRLTADAPHAPEVQSFCMVFDHPVDWARFGIWLTMLLHAHGERVLRVKGLLAVEGTEDPIFINGVQHVVHAPLHLDAWPDDDRRSRLVFIIRDLSRDLIERSARAFLAPAAVPVLAYA
jgi:G3E family GTPase